MTTGYGTPVWRAFLGYSFVFERPEAPVALVVEEEPEPLVKVEPEPVVEEEPVVEAPVCPEIGEPSGLYDEQGCPIEKEERATVTRERIELHQQIFFTYDEAVLLPESEGILRQVALALNEHDDILMVEIQGHTDHVGGPAYNLDLSQRRADTVRSFLIANEVDAARLTARGYGLQQPLATNETEEGRAQNRRVEFIIKSRADDEQR